ncbi:hypothetical protein E2C01_080549 [Portunus trituberculatus]|uniref:Uncharacterized protein n=1 Tax=Portunus trituberculatus TaxID=210409 RepID=A0A5B7IYP2_PORTR|nr:hypothetical protein [Portunus trituberculatus]
MAGTDECCHKRPRQAAGVHQKKNELGSRVGSASDARLHHRKIEQKPPWKSGKSNWSVMNSLSAPVNRGERWRGGAKSVLSCSVYFLYTKESEIHDLP